MIAKEIPKKAPHQTASFKRLIDYITRADSTDPLPANIHNCGFDRLDTAVREVVATQEMARKGHDKTYHLVLSFHPDDNITKLLPYIEEEFCKELGFGDHQRISVFHTDTENPHLHIAINRVHPETKRQHTPYYSYRTLAKLCQRFEQELGLTPDNHQDQNGISQSSRDMEVFSGKISFERYLFEDVKPNLPLEQIGSWAELHNTLGKYGIVLQQHGNGLVIQSAIGDQKPVSVAASILGREFTFDALQNRFGTWEAAQTPVTAEKTYQPAAPDNLWTQYQQLRKASLLARKQGREKLTLDRYQQQNILRSKYGALREEIKRDRLLSKRQKALLYQQLGKARQREYVAQKQQRQHERQLLVQQNPLPTWQDFLVSKAIAGDRQALKKLQHQASKRGLTAFMNTLDETQRQALQNMVKDSDHKDTASSIAPSVIEWIASRNALIGKAQDILEHRLIDKQGGEYRYQGTRQLKGAQIALLEKDGVMWVMPVSAKQQSLLRSQVRRGQTVTVGQNGYLQINKTSRSRS